MTQGDASVVLPGVLEATLPANTVRVPAATSAAAALGAMYGGQVEKAVELGAAKAAPAVTARRIARKKHDRLDYLARAQPVRRRTDADLDLVRAVLIVLPLLLCVAYLILWERKLIGWMHVRLGPNRVGPLGLLQPIADVLKLLLGSDDADPGQPRHLLHRAADGADAGGGGVGGDPVPSRAGDGQRQCRPAVRDGHQLGGRVRRDPAGWASNSKYAFIGAMRAAAQMISYEIAMGFAPVTVLMVSGSLNLSAIVNSQNTGYFAGMGLNVLSWNWLPLLPMFGVYFISGVAETNRHPFDVVEGESEIVAGHMIEYSGMAFALFFRPSTST